jgi:nitroreductase
MFTVDRALAAGSLVDYGMFLQCIMLAARARGLHTCPQAAWNDFASVVRTEIGAAENESVVCGMALGYLDPNDPVNHFDAGRVSAHAFTEWLSD